MPAAARSVFLPRNLRHGLSGVAAVRLAASVGSLLVHGLAVLALSAHLTPPGAGMLPARPIEVRLSRMQEAPALVARRPTLAPLPPQAAQPATQPATQPVATPVPHAQPPSPLTSPVSIPVPMSTPSDRAEAVDQAASVPAAPVVTPAPPSAGAGVEGAPEPGHSPPARPEPLVAARYNAAYLANPKPPYPMLSRRLGETGVVRLRVWVGTEGQALRVELELGSGYPRLDKAAMETVAGWRFIPARRGDQAVATWVLVPLAFSLD